VLETLLQPDDVNERCGLVLKDGSIVHIDNVHVEPTLGFEMDPEQVLPYLMNEEIAATWHTHPHGETALSGEDYKSFQAWPGFEHYVIGPEGVVKYAVKKGAVIVCD
jgi:proteasome lid subunit RPN8/RPN11